MSRVGLVIALCEVCSNAVSTYCAKILMCVVARKSAFLFRSTIIRYDNILYSVHDVMLSVSCSILCSHASENI